MLNKKLALELLNDSLSTGATYSELFVEKSVVTNIVYDNREVDSVSTSVVSGVGIRLTQGICSTYGFTNSLNKKELLKLSSDLKARFVGERKVTVSELVKKTKKLHHQPKIAHSEVPLAKKIEYLKEGSEVGYSYDPAIKRVRLAYAEKDSEIEIFSSKGIIANDTRTLTRVSCNTIAGNEEGFVSMGEGPGGKIGVEIFNDVDLKELVLSCAKKAKLFLSAKPCPSGTMPVILGNGFGGVLFHESCGHPLEFNSIAKELSVFSGKLGTKIASDIVSAVDDGTIENGWGSNNIDDEGNAPTRNQLIKNGILTNYMVDDFTGQRKNVPSTGACRRENYKYEPTTRMTNTYIDNGTSTVEEIIASTKLGLYAKSLGGGSVNPTTGEFNFGVSEGYVVKDGKILYPVKAATLIGSGKDVLLKIDMIANDLMRAQGMCGSSSGSIPADVGQPTLRVSEMVVGGTGGSIDEIR